VGWPSIDGIDGGGAHHVSNRSAYSRPCAGQRAYNGFGPGFLRRLAPLIVAWFAPPASGAGPVTNRSRRNGVSNYNQLVGDYTNPILQPWAAQIVKAYGEISLAGATYPNPANQCWPEPVPFIFKNNGMQILQQPHQVTILYGDGPARQRSSSDLLAA
jgi:hypothetical protein